MSSFYRKPHKMMITPATGVDQLVPKEPEVFC